MQKLIELFTHAPGFVKRVFINAEAIRRDRYRKYGRYKDLYDSVDFEDIMTDFREKRQAELIDRLLSSAKNVEYYEEYSNCTTIQEFPLLSKQDYRKNRHRLIAKDADIKKCWREMTSGSTGTPLEILCQRDYIRINKVYQEIFFEYVGLKPNERIARISGVRIAPYNSIKPPFWVYIDKYRQLQLSAYHISCQTGSMYIDAIKKYKATFGTGYPSAWLLLAEYINTNGISPPPIKAIITDSEGITLSQKEYIVKTFNCPLYQTYGLAEAGQIAVQCKEGNFHIVPSLCYAEIIDEEGNVLPNGERGEIVLTNLVSDKTPIIRYKTGDYGTLYEGLCPCGWNTQYIPEIDGRLDDYIIDYHGRKVGRITRIIRNSIGIVESQIVQERPGEIKILIVTDSDFIPESMNKVVDNVKKYLGDIKVEWQIVESFERTKAAKVRRVIRKF